MFSSFMLSEGLKSKQVLALHRFNELYRDQVMLDLHDKLQRAWWAEVRTAKASLSKAEAEEELVRNPNAVTKAVLNRAPVKSHYNGKMVSPSVSIPLTLPAERRNLLEKELLHTAELEMTRLLSDWSEAFMLEKGNGQLKTLFKVKHDGHSVRLVIAAEEGHTSHEAVICYVAVERGKPNTKRKAFDLVCLCTPSS